MDESSGERRYEHDARQPVVTQAALYAGKRRSEKSSGRTPNILYASSMYPTACRSTRIPPWLISYMRNSARRLGVLATTTRSLPDRMVGASLARRLMPSDETRSSSTCEKSKIPEYGPSPDTNCFK